MLHLFCNKKNFFTNYVIYLVTYLKTMDKQKECKEEKVKNYPCRDIEQERVSIQEL